MITNNIIINHIKSIDFRIIFIFSWRNSTTMEQPKLITNIVKNIIVGLWVRKVTFLA